ncbi:hypothetical protein ACFGYR_03965 [Pasteurella multocida]
MKENPIFELVKPLIIAAQQGKPIIFVVVDEQSEFEQTSESNCLDKAVKDQIFQTVLDSASRSTGFLPEDLAASLIEAYKKINLS